jgi:hypothetical protein
LAVAAFFTHMPGEPVQYASAAQSASVTHVVVHEPFVQRNGSQSVGMLAQLPLPSHVLPVTFVPTHVLAPHDVPAGAFAAPVHDAVVVPSHCGAAHTLEPAGHAVRAPCGAPEIGMHVPSAAATSHAWHWPPHAVLQQYPSTHCPLAHSRPRVHGIPFVFCFAHCVPAQ